VKIAYWSMDRTLEYEVTPTPGITWESGWLGTDQPTHWQQMIDVPEAPHGSIEVEMVKR
jgi:hypothetical protein